MSEQFENMIRKKLQEAEPSFDPNAWEQMKKKLDDADRRRPFFWWWAGGLLLIVAGLGSWWWFGDHGNPLNEKTPSANITQQTGQPAADKNVNNSASFPENNIPPSANTGANTNNVDNQAGKNRQHTSARDKIFNSRPRNATVVDNRAAKNNAGISSIQNRKNVDNNGDGYTKGKVNNTAGNNSSSSVPQNVNNSAAGNNPAPVSPIPGNTNKPAEENISRNVNNPAAGNPLPVIIPTAPANVDNPVQKQETITDSSATDKTEKEKPNNKQKRGFDGGLFLGPDFNVTPAFKSLPVGITGGLVVRYHVNNRWYLSSGVGYAKKLYGASPAEYSSSYPPSYYAIDADCDVIDIPLNVGYTFLQGKKSSWSAIAGASSYLMLKEKYEYYYPNNVKYKREYKNQNQHYFSVFNLGVTWEKQTRSRLSWGLQPYVKIPLNGVGQGSVRVYSAGVTAQATLGKKKD